MSGYDGSEGDFACESVPEWIDEIVLFVGGRLELFRQSVQGVFNRIINAILVKFQSVGSLDSERRVTEPHSEPELALGRLAPLSHNAHRVGGQFLRCLEQILAHAIIEKRSPDIFQELV